MLKTLIALLMLSTCSQTPNKNHDNSADKIVVKKVDFSIFTFVSVNCDDFENQFQDEYSVSTLSNDKDMDNFLEIFKDSTPLDSSFNNYLVDTRVKVEIHYNNGNIKNICMGNPAYMMDGIVYENSDKIRKYIENIKPD